MPKRHPTASGSDRRLGEWMDRDRLAKHFREIRRQTESLCDPLEVEDCLVQAMPDASPTKWHLAHTSWFYETFLLHQFVPGYVPYHPEFTFLFNSYYNAVGTRWPRPARGLLSRPTLGEIFGYRAAIDQRMIEAMPKLPEEDLQEFVRLTQIGLQHEQQHQELILTDIKAVFGLNPLAPSYQFVRKLPPSASLEPIHWQPFERGLGWLGYDGNGFCYDNELPRHQVHLEAFEIASRLVTVGEYLAFIAEDGYARPELWLSDGWNTCQKNGWQAPHYWQRMDGEWQIMTLHGLRSLDLLEPVCHLSYYEADAFARWSGARLPTEAEWRTAASDHAIDGNFMENGYLHPIAHDCACQFYGDVWEWTCSPYTPYPGYRPAAGALGEYNGKFMCNQLVLCGGSCVTPRSHIRPSYRNFFPPEARWQFSGFRLARDT